VKRLKKNMLERIIEKIGSAQSTFLHRREDRKDDA
jgi:hypothetical protein